MSTKDVIRIGNAGGYWGDDPTALARQVRGGQLDYITMDFLAEVTMSIMQKQRKRDASLGYARDFVTMIEPILKEIIESGICIITNAGGVNPPSCAAAISELARRLGQNPKIAVVYGDDILDQAGSLSADGVAFENMETGQSFSEVAQRLEAANIYFGASPVVKALQCKPDIILTGRVTDTGITVAPMMYEFGWSFDDWDRLAAGVVAGHILECGSQATGGNFTDWHKVRSFDNMGYPIVEMHRDGSFFVTKHPDTGGIVTVDTVREQLFYEMGDPKAYLTPDVVADFSSIQLEDAGPDRVRVSGIKGFEPTPFYKVSMAYRDGYKAIGSIVVSGADARSKAEKFSEIFWEKCEGDYSAKATEYLGWNACHRSLGHVDDGAEIVLRLGARSDDQQVLNKFGKLVPSLILGGPPGVAVLGGVSKPQEVVSYWPALIPKNLVYPKVAVWEHELKNITEVREIVTGQFEAGQASKQVAESADQTIQQVLTDLQGQRDGGVPLIEICLARSGDKGDTANIGVLARSPQAYAFLDQYLTAQRIKNWFQELCLGKVIRYDVPNMLGFNFLLESSLGGGGTKTLRTDAQGKTFAQAILRQVVKVPADVRTPDAKERASR